MACWANGKDSENETSFKKIYVIVTDDDGGEVGWVREKEGESELSGEDWEIFKRLIKATKMSENILIRMAEKCQEWIKKRRYCSLFMDDNRSHIYPLPSRHDISIACAKSLFFFNEKLRPRDLAFLSNFLSRSYATIIIIIIASFFFFLIFLG